MTTSRTAYASLPGLFLIAARAVVESGRHNLPPLTDGESLAWAGVNRSGAILLVLDGENHILREYAILLADNEHEDGVFAECALITPDQDRSERAGLPPQLVYTPTTVEAIRAEISRLEGELSRLSGKPLIIYDQGGSYYENCDIPAGGALLTYSPAISEYGYQEWYPTLEAAKAALLKMGRENNTMPDATGLNLDLTPEAAQFSTCAYITRR